MKRLMQISLGVLAAAGIAALTDLPADREWRKCGEVEITHPLCESWPDAEWQRRYPSDWKYRKAQCHGPVSELWTDGTYTVRVDTPPTSEQPFVAPDLSVWPAAAVSQAERYGCK